MELGGRIQDLHTGKMLMGVQVDCYGQGRQMSYYSKPNGSFVFRGLTPGSWLLKLTKGPYKTTQVTYVLTESRHTCTLGLEIPNLQDEHVTA